MARALFALALIVMQLILAEPSFGQAALAEHKIRALKGLRTLAVVLLPNTPREVVTPKEWGDMVEVGLHRHLPALKFLRPTDTSDWLELSVITTDAGGSLELSLYRWVQVVASGEEIVAKVWWDSRGIFGSVSRRALQESLDALLTSFAADYLRANP